MKKRNLKLCNICESEPGNTFLAGNQIEWMEDNTTIRWSISKNRDIATRVCRKCLVKLMEKTTTIIKNATGV